MKIPPHRLNQRGWTLVELMMVTALIGIITPALTFLFTKVSQGMAADEMHIQLQSLNSQSLLRLHERVAGAKHLFQADNSGVSYLAAVTLGMAATTKANYPILSGSKLAQTQPATIGTTKLASFSTTKGGAAGYFGNSLLFGGFDSKQVINNVTYYSPVTIYTSATSPVTYADGKPATVVMDLFRFYYYYLTDKNPKGIKGFSSYRLIEWQSNQYADYNQIYNISLNDTYLAACVCRWLAAAGNISAGYNITRAWDTSESDPSKAFFKLDVLSGTPGYPTSVTGAVSITEHQSTALTRVTSGILSNGFGYGISANTAGWKDAPPVAVPLYATSNGNFPGGFEVGISGNAAGRQVFTRLFLVAKGASPRVVYNDGALVHNVRDVW